MEVQISRSTAEDASKIMHRCCKERHRENIKLCGRICASDMMLKLMTKAKLKIKLEFGHCQAVRMFGCCIHEVKIAGKTAEHPEEETTYKDVPFHP